jgi:hypothetical protein
MPYPQNFVELSISCLPNTLSQIQSPSSVASSRPLRHVSGIVEKDLFNRKGHKVVAKDAMIKHCY